MVDTTVILAGAIPAAGTVERGTTVCDYAPLEKQLQHSLKLAVASFEAKVDDEPTRIGHVGRAADDFEGACGSTIDRHEAEAALRRMRAHRHDGDDFARVDPRAVFPGGVGADGARHPGGARDRP